MKKIRRIISSVMIMLMSASSTAAFAQELHFSNSMQIEASNTTTNQGVKSRLKTVDGQEIYLPESNKIKEFEQKLNRKARSFSLDNSNDLKSVADFKTMALTELYGCTSVQYSLIDNGEIVLSGGSGVYSKENNEPISEDNMYAIASISKMFATTAIMKLVDKGLVDLDAPVTKYISEFEMADARYKDITVRMLLNHSSGLMGSCYNNAILLSNSDTYVHDTILSQLKTQRLKSNPGEYSVYCNDGFTLAEIIVERVTGNSFTNFVKNNITDPLAMSNTKSPLSYDFDREKLAKIYELNSDKALPVESLNMIGAGGLYSNTEDLCKFAATFTDKSNGVLSKDSVTEMENKEYLNGIWPEGEDNIFGYGLGWDSVDLYPFNQYGIKALTKNGDSIYYHSNLIVLPELNMAIAVASSGGSSTWNMVMAQEILLEALLEKGVIDEILPNKSYEKPEMVAVPTELKEFEGRYFMSNNILDIKIDETGFVEESYPLSPSSPKSVYIHTGDGVFKTTDGSISIKFVKESNGKTYIQQIVCGDLPFLGQTVLNTYEAQKVEDNILSEEVAKVWNERNGKLYYLVNEKYSSIYYSKGAVAFGVGFHEGLEGYLGLNKIVDENSAMTILECPVAMSRDQSDMIFSKKDNYEYVSYQGRIYAEESSIKDLSSDNKFNSTINGDGYANWYNISNDVAGKEIVVNVPEEASFTVYDSYGNPVHSSLLTGSNEAVLPENGKIVFVGRPYANFIVSYK